MNPKETDRLPPDQLVDHVAKNGEKSGVTDETVRREAAKPRETSPTGAPKKTSPKKP